MALVGTFYYTFLLLLVKLHDEQYRFACISLTADGPQHARLPIHPIATLPSCLWSLKIFRSLPGSHLTHLYHDARTAHLQLVNR